MDRRALFQACFALLVPLVIAVPTWASEHLIDFETPKLDYPWRLTINPYQDPGTGVVFSGLPTIYGDSEVGLVINGQTSVCIPGDFSDQKLGGAPLGTNAVGLASVPIRADFPTPLLPPCTVSVEIQTLAGRIVRLRLFDAAGAQVSAASQVAGPPVEGCFPGDPRAAQRVTATSDQPVSYAIMDMTDINIVYVIDDFTFSSNEPEPLTAAVDLDPDVLNLSSRAPWITAYIEPSGFAPTDIDLTSLRLAGSVSAVPKFGLVGDHNGNGIPDLMVKFGREALDPLLVLGTNILELTGSLLTGESFTGVDSVTVIDPTATLSASVAPNPLNPAGKLTFVTTKPGPARITVFDVAGRAVRTVLDSPSVPAGTHEVRIDGFDQRGKALATGVYFYRVESSGASASGRIVLLK